MAAIRVQTDSRWTNSGEMLRQLLIREIAESVRGSSLGVIWLVFNPLLSMTLYVIVFGVLFGGSFGMIENETSLNYAIGVYIGLSMVNLINENLSKSTSTLQRHSNLVKKVVFPLELLPIVQVLSVAFKLAVNAVLWLAMGAVFGSVLSLQILWLPLLILPMLGTALGLAWLVGAISVYLRDTQQITSVITQIVFWSSGVFYSSRKVMEVPAIWSALKWNPVLLAIENIRAVVLWGLPPDLGQVAYLYLFATACLGIGYLFFSRLQAGFSDFL